MDPQEQHLRNILRVIIKKDRSVSDDSFTEAFKTLARNNPLNLVELDGFVLGAADETDLERLCGDLAKLVKFTTSDVRVLYLETVAAKSIVVSAGVLGKSRVHMTAEPICSDLAKRIVSGEMSSDINAAKRLETLTNEMQWDQQSINSIWSFGPDNNNSNVLVYSPAKSTDSGLSAITKEGIINVFKNLSCRGILIYEALVGVRFTITNLEYPSDAENRRSNVNVALGTTSPEALSRASPRLVEPVQLYRFKAPQSETDLIYGMAQHYKGTIVNETTENQVSTIDVHIPVSKTFGLVRFFKSKAGDNMSVEVTFSHWQVNDSDPYDGYSDADKPRYLFSLLTMSCIAQTGNPIARKTPHFAFV
eukprot:gene19710-23605_t